MSAYCVSSVVGETGAEKESDISIRRRHDSRKTESPTFCGVYLDDRDSRSTDCEGDSLNEARNQPVLKPSVCI